MPADRRIAARLACDQASIEMTFETFKAWQCIGCGRIDGPQNCIGVCHDRKVELVYASELKASLARIASLRDESAALHAFVRQLAGITPRDGQWEQSFRSMQERAKAILGRRAENMRQATSETTTAPTPAGETRAREA